MKDTITSVIKFVDSLKERNVPSLSILYFADVIKNHFTSIMTNRDTTIKSKLQFMHSFTNQTNSFLKPKHEIMKTRATQFSNWIGGLVLLMTVMLFGVTNTQAQTILSQNFESTWTTPSTLSPAWSTAANATGGANALWAASNAPTSAIGLVINQWWIHTCWCRRNHQIGQVP